MTLDIGIIGGGTAGAACAILLGRAGHNVTLYEAVPKPGPVGAGIMLQPTGQWVLEKLGLLGPILDHGAHLERLHVRTTQQKTLLDLHYRDLSPGLYGLGLQRGVLFQTLFEAAQKSATVHCGVEIRDLARANEGRWLVDVGGKRHGPHQLVIVGDGAGSDLRDDTPLRAAVRHYSWGALWFLADHPPFPDRLQQVVRGTGKMLGMLPSGRGLQGSQEQVSLFWSLRCDQAEHWKRDFSGWKAEVLGMEPAAAPILDQIHHPEQLLFARYRDVWMSRWNTEDVVYLGDAAHAMSPQLGQGANLALVDAWVLSECLSAAPLPQALDLYTRKRRFNLLYYQLATRYLTPFFQSDLEPVGWFRDLAMPMAAQIPWVRRQMIASMAGVKNGLLSMMPLQQGRLLSGPS